VTPARKLRRTRPSGALIVGPFAILLVSGCTGDFAPQGGVPAVFELRSVNRAPLPYTISSGRDQLGPFTYQVASATITLIEGEADGELERGGVFEYVYTMNEVRGSRTAVLATNEHGRYSILPNSTVMLTYEDGSTDVGSIAVTLGQITFVTRTAGAPALVYDFMRRTGGF
jgi:hypothetical protein